MKKAKMTALVVTVIFILSGYIANAQMKWSFEFRPGVNFATKNLGDANLKTGFGFEGTLAYKFMPHLGLYAGWSWNKFAAENSFMGSNMDFEETGYCFGLQFIHPIEKTKINYLLRGGAVYNHIETENSEGKIINDTGHGWGWQIGGGIAIPFGKRLMLTPEIRYRSLSRDIKVGDVKTPVDLNYVSAGAGLSFSF
ncbi:MAG TPA: outer membrane beta-barrel protein [Niabella sp.]|nr:outer membrane beta-barrel protein [Niabella sp.]HOZ96467.1 outer membrane beta-barrel protein [Niabella sp.]HQW13352.1 outer membrane beta-barrel protein [Niabella sp.]HQX18608.1 outer membrane beta-barrel protein [Niabella sp.]HRB06505.1 outer membrane beta-barrel protein [Niabella sp.]